MSDPDIIDTLVGIRPGSRLDRIRGGRAQARENAEASYRALFAPEAPGDLAPDERFAVGSFVAALHRVDAATGFYADALRRTADKALVDAVAAAAAAGMTEGPYGAFPPGPLSPEDRPGLVLALDPALRATLGPRIAAALQHAHLLVFRPREASAAALQALLDAGLTTTAVVTLSQIVAFLSFQIRVVAGLQQLSVTLDPGAA